MIVEKVSIRRDPRLQVYDDPPPAYDATGSTSVPPPCVHRRHSKNLPPVPSHDSSPYSASRNPSGSSSNAPRGSPGGSPSHSPLETHDHSPSSSTVADPDAPEHTDIMNRSIQLSDPEVTILEQSPSESILPLGLRPPLSISQRKGLTRSRTSVALAQSYKPHILDQVRTLVLDLLRDLVKQSDDSSADLMLKGCSEACHSYGLPTSSLLQEPLIEGHTFIYWVIIRRNPILHPSDSPSSELMLTFFSLAAPLTDVTMSELRLACLHNSDQALYQQLRRWPVFSPSSGPEETLMHGSFPPDEIEVENAMDDDRAFIARFRVPMFQKRLRVSKQINLEFIARGRLWSVRIIVASADNARIRPKVKRGTCLVTLSLLEHSPPTWVDSCFVIHDSHGSHETNSPILSRAGRSRTRKGSKGLPMNSLRLKTGSAQLTAQGSKKFIAASFKDSQMAENLQNHENTFVAADGSFEARLEARLGKPEAECVIC